MNTQHTLMWKQYCIWCVSINVCDPFSLWWMCNEVAEASIQQFSIYELLTFDRRGLNITPSRNNSAALAPSPAPLPVLHLQASHAKQMVWPEFRAKEEASGTTILVKSALNSCFVMAYFNVCHMSTSFELYYKYEAILLVFTYFCCFFHWTLDVYILPAVIKSRTETQRVMSASVNLHAVLRVNTHL